MVGRWWIGNRRFVFDYLSTHPCVDCGESDPIVLEFDHLRDKEYGVAVLIRARRSIEVIQQEIEKCEVVCANCHRRRTAVQFGWACLSYESPLPPEILSKPAKRLSKGDDTPRRRVNREKKPQRPVSRDKKRRKIR